MVVIIWDDGDTGEGRGKRGEWEEGGKGREVGWRGGGEREGKDGKKKESGRGRDIWEGGGGPGYRLYLKWTSSLAGDTSHNSRASNCQTGLRDYRSAWSVLPRGAGLFWRRGEGGRARQALQQS